uniref:Uncharacterized protein n=1 Tax=Romanomermis culicivorax TaxID=13658 RepID=A0A915I3C2_ROMCU
MINMNAEKHTKTGRQSKMGAKLRHRRKVVIKQWAPKRDGRQSETSAKVNIAKRFKVSEVFFEQYDTKMRRENFTSPDQPGSFIMDPNANPLIEATRLSKTAETPTFWNGGNNGKGVGGGGGLSPFLAENAALLMVVVGFALGLVTVVLVAALAQYYYCHHKRSSTAEPCSSADGRKKKFHHHQTSRSKKRRKGYCGGAGAIVDGISRSAGQRMSISTVPIYNSDYGWSTSTKRI